MNTLINIVIAIAKTFQLLLVLILSLLLHTVNLNNSLFSCRWQFESCNFQDLRPEGDENVIDTLKKIWRFKRS